MRGGARGRSAIGAAAAIVLVAGLTSCSESGPPMAVSTGGADITLAHAGHWTEDFRAALTAGVSPFEEKILADGAITAEELETAHDRVRSCLADSGFGIEYDPDGGFEVTSLTDRYPDDFFDRSDPVLRSCEQRFDEHVTMLFEQTRRNPEKLDDAKITVACLRESGLVGPDYSTQQFREDYDVYEFPFSSSDEGWRQCDLDPLGLWRTP